MINKYAQLIVKKGLNIQKGQDLVITADVECAPLVKAVAKAAFAAGARDVIPHYVDDEIAKACYMHNDVDYFKEVPNYLVDLHNDYAKKHAAVLSITSEDPEMFKEVDPMKMQTRMNAMHEACKLFYDHLDLMIDRWCIVGAPSKRWANKVFPDMSDQEALEALWQAIYHVCYVDTPDPLKTWDLHRVSFENRVNKLNAMKIRSLHYTNSLGTDLTVGMNKDYLFAGGGSYTTDGIYSFPNMPTEEIFTSPNFKDVNGIVYASLPLNNNGTLIKDFSLTFKDGRIVAYEAKEGLEALRSMIETDEGSHYLGEAALVPYDSPISQMGILFYNTLFDENAACHLAIGKGFAECLKDGVGMSKEELYAHGVNDSLNHVDFMIGTPDLNIEATLEDGSRVMIFKDGIFAI
ncbi:MAG: aminopeptidase [Intestinibaculum porci]|uniref:aminopeptidase n=1 Tax=Intestinibaculum porci TaxID=2487118 RepID=UPI003EFCAF3D